MPTQTYYVVQAFKQEDGAIVPVKPNAAPGEASARALAQMLAVSYVGVIAWSRTGDPDLGEWGPPETIFSTGLIPDEFEAGGGVE